MTSNLPDTNPLDDRDIVRRVRTGDETAYAELITAYGERIYNMLLQLCNGDPDMASELTQEAFVRAYERLNQFDGGSSFYTWLYRLARNRALDVRKRKQPIASDPLTMHDPGHKNDPSAAIEQSELKALVQSGLQLLNPEQREIILLRDFDEHDYSAIANLLEIAEGTVKSRLNRARAALRGHIESLASSDQIGGLRS